MKKEEITIKDEWNEVFPEEIAQLEYEEYEKPRRSKEGAFDVYTQTSLGPCCLKTTVKHNGKIPGDAGHGGKVEIEFESDYIDHYYPGTISVSAVSERGFKITLLGEWERKQFVSALEQIVAELK